MRGTPRLRGFLALERVIGLEPTKMVKGSGYLVSEPAPWFGQIRNGQIVEPDDEESP